jgi:hypothetical protein
VKAVPVPSQRQAYAKMEERQNAGKISSQTSTNFLANNAPISLRSTFTKEILRIPSVEEIQLPESIFFELFSKFYIYSTILLY